MFNKVSEWLQSTLQIDVDEQDSENTIQLAAAVLLLEVSRADFEISEIERQVIVDVLTKRLELSLEEATTILKYALDEHEQYTSAHPFIRLLNEELDHDKKLSLLQGLWEVAYADGVLDKYEEYHIRKIADWLYLSHADFIRLKNKVTESM